MGCSAALALAAQRRALEVDWPAFGIDIDPDQREKLELTDIFGRTADKVVEIGFGNGDNLVEYARQDPTRDFLGIEIHRAGVGHALLHAMAYAWLDQGWDMAEVLGDVWKRPFILVGTLAMLILSALAATSFNSAVRRLGAQRWRRLHQAVYGVAALSVLHFWWMRAGKNDFTEVWLYGAVLAGLLAWRVWHHWRSLRQANRA